MVNFQRPVIGVSKCLGFAACRYDGATISAGIIELLKPYVDFQPVCPEVAIGLGIPRAPVRVVRSGASFRLLQPETQLDFTEKMQAFTTEYLNRLGPIDGWILKSRSPSCGLHDVKIYAAAQNPIPVGKGSGFFGAEVLKRYAPRPVSDEGRLSNFRLREHFFTQIFCLASFRAVCARDALRDLIQFQAENKYLLMAYHQQELRKLGKIVANPERRALQNIFQDYEQHLLNALARPPRTVANINVLMHTFGYFSEKLTAPEKAFFLDTLNQYREEQVPLSVPVNLIQAWIARFQTEYLQQQTFFQPYPLPLVQITDSGKGRDW